jgi:predicted ATP-dependent endonuclease of OLD family
MRHAFFEIDNYKGISHVRLDMDAQPRGNIYTLVGLNESGKTTILEALNFIAYNNESLDPLNLPGSGSSDVHDLIPIGKRSNFNGSISIRAGYTFDSNDNDRLTEFMDRRLHLKLAVPLETVEITRHFEFVDSRNTTSRLTWKINIQAMSGRSRKSQRLNAGTPHWNQITDYIITMPPSVLYFPNFLFEFPDKIYLEDSTADTRDDAERHRLYRSIMQDVLAATDDRATLEKHVLDRAKSGERRDRQAISSVLLKMSLTLTRDVFTAWNQILHRHVDGKEIVVDWDCDDDKDGRFVHVQPRLQMPPRRACPTSGDALQPRHDRHDSAASD